MALGAFYLCFAYAINILAPKIAGKFQVSATVIKLIPLAVMMIVGTVAGLINGNTVDAFTQTTTGTAVGFSSVFSGIAAAAFAYEGWIIATSINAELREPKKHLPIALVLGTAIIMAVYVLYFIGLTGGASVDVLREEGSATAFKNLLGNAGGTVLNIFVVVSCLGTLNGLMLATTRSFYSIAVRGHGPRPEMFCDIEKNTKMPTNAGVLGLLMCAIWFFYFYASNLTTPVFGVFSFDSSELPIITIYGMYVPIFIMFIIKEGKKDVFRNVVMPILATIASLFMVFVAIYAHGIVPYQNAAAKGEFAFPVLFYLIVFIVIMAIGAVFYKKNGKKGE